mmetsp:Transcript_11546/g.18095  ORF Transcript_11546/g.18095 Transcript_11546/m.18095 type:complete len:304 (+) Transcript_11546:115-1026(+)
MLLLGVPTNRSGIGSGPAAARSALAAGRPDERQQPGQRDGQRLLGADRARALPGAHVRPQVEELARVLRRHLQVLVLVHGRLQPVHPAQHEQRPLEGRQREPRVLQAAGAALGGAHGEVVLALGEGALREHVAQRAGQPHGVAPVQPGALAGRAGRRRPPAGHPLRARLRVQLDGHAHAGLQPPVQQQLLGQPAVDERALAGLGGPVQRDALAEGARVVPAHVVRRVQRVQQAREPQVRVLREQGLAQVLRRLQVLQHAGQEQVRLALPVAAAAAALAPAAVGPAPASPPSAAAAPAMARLWA